jgi:MYXO-CTERM domain-containing protein
MRAHRVASVFLVFAIVLVGAVANAVPKTYIFTGKFMSNRGPVINVPLVGNTPCNGVGFANLTVMSGPGGKVVPAPVTPTMHTKVNLAGNYGCVAAVKGKKITTTGAGVGGAFVMPTHVFSRPLQSYVAAVHVPNQTPVVQFATSFIVSAPLKTPTTPLGGSMVKSFAPAAFHAFKKSAWMTQTGRGAQKFTWCFGNPACAKITQGTRPVIVKYAGGGGNAFGGTMAYVITAVPGISSLAIGAGGGALGFARLSGMGSQPTGRGYASYGTDMLAQGPLWAAYKTMTVTRPKVGKQKLVTMVTGFLGSNFPKAYNYNFGFPWTTMTVLARNTGTVAGNPKVTTLTAKGGDTVTGMGKRNLSLVAGAVSRAVLGPATSHFGEIGQMYLPEPSRASQMFAAAAGLLAIAAWRRRASY